MLTLGGTVVGSLMFVVSYHPQDSEDRGFKDRHRNHSSLHGPAALFLFMSSTAGHPPLPCQKPFISSLLDTMLGVRLEAEAGGLSRHEVRGWQVPVCLSEDRAPFVLHKG